MTISFKWRALLPAVTLFTFLAPRSYGQVAVAEVSGVVSDATGGTIPGAQVKITEIEKQFSRSASSDAAGRFTFPNLPVGPYRMDVSASGFKGYTQTGIILQVGNSVTVDIAMQVGNISEHVEVTAQTNMVETRDNTISQVIDEQRISELPLNGRQPTQLILLSGAALTTPGGGMVGSKNYFSSVTISVAGGQANGINYLLDGGDHNDSMTNVNMPIPFPDALQEFSVQTSALPAKYGLHPGAVVNAVTKSGTNAYHGDVFEFLRNGKINARNTFASFHDSLKRNQFGGTIGGPILKDKLFFFAGYQGTRQRSDPPQTTSFVATSAVLGGDFSTIDGGGCVANGRKVIDPLTKSPTNVNGDQFPGNKIPVSRFNPQAVKLITTYIPLSSDPCGKLVYGIKTTGDEGQYISRFDWIQNAKHSLYGRYFMAQYVNPPVFDGKNALTTTAPGNDERAQTMTIGDNYSFNATTLNAFHATFSRRRDNRGVAANYFNPSTLGLNVATPIPNFTQVAVNNYWSIGCGTCAPGFFNTNSLHLADDVDIIRGKHQFGFGVDFLRDQFNFANGFTQNGSWTFNGSNFTGDALADFMLGVPSAFGQSNRLEMATRASVLAMYVQDVIRVKKGLTVTVGIRWEPSFAAYDYFGKGTSFTKANFDAGVKSQVFTNAPAGLLFYGDQGIPKGYFNNKVALFSPRLGVVWDPTGSGKQSIRVSGGILRDTAELFYSERLTTNSPYGTSIGLTNPVGGFTNPFLGYPGGNPFPAPAPPPKTFAFPPLSVFVNMPLETHPTYTMQWNLSYQNEFAKNWLGSIAYLGNKTNHVWVGEEINPGIYRPGATTNPDTRRVLYLQNPTAGGAYGSIVQSDQGANSRYAGMLVSVQHRFADHFTLLWNYTRSHCISDADFGGELAGNYYSNPANRSQDKGNCNFDVRNLMNTSLVAQSPFKGGLKGKILGGWQLSPIVTAASGIAINLTLGRDNAFTGVGLDRPNQVLSNAYSTDPNPRLFLNPAAFANNAVAGTYGNLGRDAIHGPGRLNFDAALSRSFSFKDHYRLEARFEAFNLINHVNYNNPTTALSSSNFGKILGAADPRILQASMKFHF